MSFGRRVEPKEPPATQLGAGTSCGPRLCTATRCVLRGDQPICRVLLLRRKLCVERSEGCQEARVVLRACLLGVFARRDPLQCVRRTAVPAGGVLPFERPGVDAHGPGYAPPKGFLGRRDLECDLQGLDPLCGQSLRLWRPGCNEARHGRGCLASGRRRGRSRKGGRDRSRSDAGEECAGGAGSGRNLPRSCITNLLWT